MKSDLKPIRETKIEVTERILDNAQEIFAVCLETDDHDLLIPFKIYRIKLRGDYVCVTGKRGESTVYLSSFFLPLQLPPKTANLLSTAYVHS